MTPDAKLVTQDICICECARFNLVPGLGSVTCSASGGARACSGFADITITSDPLNPIA